MPNIHRTVPSLPELPSPFNNKYDVYATSTLFDTKPKPTNMSSNQTSSPDRKQSKASDASSILSTSTTSSMTALLKSKFTPKSKQGKPVKLEDELSPGEKQALRRQDRMDPRVLATIASLKSKAAKMFEEPTEDASDAYQARKGTQFLRGGSL